MIKFKQKGLTLVELLVAMSILSILTLIIGQIYVNNVRSVQRQQINAQLQRQGKIALDEIISDVRSAWEVKEQVIDGDTQYKASEKVLILKVPALDDEGNIKYEGEEILYFDYIIYTIENSKRVVKNTIIDPQSQRPREQNHTIAEDVDFENSSFTYQPKNPPSSWPEVQGIRVDLELKKAVANIEVKLNLTSQAKLRNWQ